MRNNDGQEYTQARAEEWHEFWQSVTPGTPEYERHQEMRRELKEGIEEISNSRVNDALAELQKLLEVR